MHDMAMKTPAPQRQQPVVEPDEKLPATPPHTAEEEFLDDIREGLRELQEGEALFDSRQRLKELRTQFEHGTDPS